MTQLISFITMQQPQKLVDIQDLRQIRIGLGITVRYAANILGISHSTLSHYETRTSKIPVHIHKNYCTFLEQCFTNQISFQKRKVPLSNILANAANARKDRITQDEQHTLTKIRKALGIKPYELMDKVAPGYNQKTWGNYEPYRYAMPRKFFNLAMKFFKTVKLQKIFGSHYNQNAFLSRAEKQKA